MVEELSSAFAMLEGGVGGAMLGRQDARGHLLYLGWSSKVCTLGVTLNHRESEKEKKKKAKDSIHQAVVSG